MINEKDKNRLVNILKEVNNTDDAQKRSKLVREYRKELEVLTGSIEEYNNTHAKISSLTFQSIKLEEQKCLWCNNMTTYSCRLCDDCLCYLHDN